MSHPSITALPDYPVRGDDQTTFATKANATVAAMPTMVTETNAVTAWIGEKADNVEVQSATTEDYFLKLVAIAATYAEGHQGAHATPPTLRNDGTALRQNDMYYDTVSGKMKIWSV